MGIDKDVGPATAMVLDMDIHRIDMELTGHGHDHHDISA
jgi:hypothetical protein